MNDFQEWLKTTPEYQTLVFQHGERLFIQRDGEFENLTVRLAYRAWSTQQVNIDQLNNVLDERTKEWLQAIECGSYFENVAKPLKEENDNLKAQLNNMEACYIEKKKQVEAVEHQKSLQELEISQISQANQEWQRVNGELAKALRGDNA